MRHTCLHIFLALLASMTHLQAHAACELGHSVFRDAANQGFTLEFSPSVGEDATVVALAQLKHKARGVIFKFEVGQSNGFGTFFLTRTDTAKPQSSDVYFFDARLIATPVNTAAWVFVAGLGSADWYDTRKEPQVGDTLW